VQALEWLRNEEVEITPEFDRPARIIPAVGPRRDQAGMWLSFCYLWALDLEVSKDLRSAVSPCLGTGIFGIDKTAAADIALVAVSSWLRHRGSNSTIVTVGLAINQDNDEKLDMARWPKVFPASESATSLPEASDPNKKRAEGRSVD
jgi:O-acetyl-ADP-ribose deacetylase (regulator of RNase III)